MPPFKPGQSGNPRGRPKTDRAIQSLCRSKAPEIVDKLVELALAGDPACARLVLAYGYGTPQARVDLTTKDEAITMPSIIRHVVVEGRPDAPPTRADG
jgi:hypothetical protein